MPVPTLGFKLKIENQSQFFSDFSSKLGNSISGKMRQSFNVEMGKFKKDLQKDLSFFQIRFDRGILKNQLKWVRDQMTTATAIELQLDKKKAMEGVTALGIEFDRFYEHKSSLDLKSRKLAVENLKVQTKAMIEHFGKMEKEAVKLLTSTDAEERKLGKTLREEVIVQTEQWKDKLHKAEQPIKNIEAGLENIRKTGSMAYDNISKWGTRIGALAVTYFGISAIKSALFDVTKMQDDLMAKSVQGGVAVGNVMGAVQSGAKSAVLPMEELVPFMGELSTRGQEAWKGIAPYTNELAKMKKLGTDIVELNLQNDFLRAAKTGPQATKAFMDVSKSMFAIGNAEIRNKVLTKVVEGSRVMGTKAPQWMEAYGKGTIKAAYALEKLGVRSEAITSYMDKLSELGAFAEDEEGQFIQMFGGEEAWAKVFMGDMSAALPALQNFGTEYSHLFDILGDPSRGAMAQADAMRQLMSIPGVDKQKIEMTQTLLEAGPKEVLKLMEEMKAKGPEAMQEQFTDRIDNAHSAMINLKNEYDILLQKLSTTLLPAFTTMINALKDWMGPVGSPEFESRVLNWSSAIKSAAEAMVSVVNTLGGPTGVMKAFAALWIGKKGFGFASSAAEMMGARGGLGMAGVGGRALTALLPTILPLMIPIIVAAVAAYFLNKTANQAKKAMDESAKTTGTQFESRMNTGKELLGIYKQQYESGKLTKEEYEGKRSETLGLMKDVNLNDESNKGKSWFNNIFSLGGQAAEGELQKGGEEIAKGAATSAQEKVIQPIGFAIGHSYVWDGIQSSIEESFQGKETLKLIASTKQSAFETAKMITETMNEYIKNSGKAGTSSFINTTSTNTTSAGIVDGIVSVGSSAKNWFNDKISNIFDTGKFTGSVVGDFIENLRQSIQSNLNRPYGFGSKSEVGAIDCSGFVSQVQREASRSITNDIKSNVNTMNVSASEQIKQSLAITADQLKPGDIIGVTRAKVPDWAEGRYKNISHVAQVYADEKGTLKVAEAVSGGTKGDQTVEQYVNKLNTQGATAHFARPQHVQEIYNQAGMSSLDSVSEQQIAPIAAASAPAEADREPAFMMADSMTKMLAYLALIARNTGTQIGVQSKMADAQQKANLQALIDRDLEFLKGIS